MEKRELEILIERTRSLLFGLFAKKIDESGSPIILAAGSGIFTAPFLGITARHNSVELHRLDWRGDPRNRPKKGVVGPTEYSAYVFQGSRQLPIWQVNSTFVNSWTDISLVYLSAHNEAAEQLAREKMPFFPWRTQPPPQGAEVVLFGFPGFKAEKGNGDKVNISAAEMKYKIARVLEVHEQRANDTGKGTFPCFLIDQFVEHGFSGGPVIYNGELCGMLSSDADAGKGTYAASLWPLALMTCEFKGQIFSKMPVSELLNKKIINSSDWKQTNSRISVYRVEGVFNPLDYAKIDL